MKNNIPRLLIFSRIVFSFIIIILTIFKPVYFKDWIIILMFTGLLSDIFDGIVARRLGISTQKLRRLDSTVDQVFWLSIVVSCYILNPSFFKSNLYPIIIILGLEAMCYLVSFLKFKKEVATHALSSKLWTLILFATLAQIILTGGSGLLFNICIYFGILTRLEIIAIFLIIKNWTSDVPTVYHAILIRKGKPIKRHKLFNG
jgi:phosphatidylglycerophosphate synthase